MLRASCRPIRWIIESSDALARHAGRVRFPRTCLRVCFRPKWTEVFTTKEVVMRKARIKVTNLVAVYHCISRIVGEEYLLDDLCKENFRCFMWQQAEFAGLQILTYCLMTNHVHILVRVCARNGGLRRRTARTGPGPLWARGQFVP